MSLFLLTVITCAAMVLKDAVGIFMTVAEARGNERLAALLNPLGTIAGIAFYSFGAITMLKHGVAGVLCIGFVLAVDYLDGRYFTRWSKKIKSSNNEETHGCTCCRQKGQEAGKASADAAADQLRLVPLVSTSKNW
jgi:hypothetical protein